VTKSYAEEEEPHGEGTPINFAAFNKNGAGNERSGEHLPHFGHAKGEGIK
jgi:hypothetical protein